MCFVSRWDLAVAVGEKTTHLDTLIEDNRLNRAIIISKTDVTLHYYYMQLVENRNVLYGIPAD